MRAAFDAYFTQLASRARIAGPNQQVIEREVPKAWRSDARAFLLLNVDVMVVQPYLSVRVAAQPNAPPPRVDRTPLWEPLLEDLRRIIGVAEDIATERDRAYVSATSVAIALGRLAPQLLTTSFQIWGPDDDGPPP